MHYYLAIVQISCDADWNGRKSVNQDENWPRKNLIIKTLTSVIPFTAANCAVELNSGASGKKKYEWTRKIGLNAIVLHRLICVLLAK